MSDASVVTEVEAAEPDDRNTIEILAAILLGLAGLLTAYAAYYGALAGGDALKGYTQSQRTLQDANSYYNDTLGYFNQDQSVFLQYQIKIEENADDVAQVIRETLFSDRLETVRGVERAARGRRDAVATGSARIRDRGRRPRRRPLQPGPAGVR